MLLAETAAELGAVLGTVFGGLVTASAAGVAVLRRWLDTTKAELADVSRTHMAPADVGLAINGNVQQAVAHVLPGLLERILPTLIHSTVQAAVDAALTAERTRVDDRFKLERERTDDKIGHAHDRLLLEIARNAPKS